MKPLNILSIIGLLCGLTVSAHAQQIVTLLLPPTAPSGGTYRTNTLAIAEDQAVRVLSASTELGGYLEISRDGTVIMRVGGTELRLPDGVSGFIRQEQYVVGGPAEVRLVASEPGACFTVEVIPSQFPPGKTAVIGERDGPMKCTLEESTDLVNWTQSTSGATHTLTNANAKKFFRIKLEQDVSP